MFSSNQVFDILVTEEQLKGCIDFAMAMSNSIEMFTRDQGRVSLAFAEPAEGVYAIGRGSMPRCPWSGPIQAGKGWTDCQFDYDTDILSRIIWQWAGKQTYDDSPRTDGTVEKGLRCMSLYSAEVNGMLPPLHTVSASWSSFETILVFVPAWHQYDK